MKSFEEVLSKANAQISDFETKRIEGLQLLKKQVSKGILAGVLLFGASIFMSILSYNGWIIIIGFIISLVVFFVIRGNILVKLRKSFKEQVLKKMIEMIDPSFEYHPAEHISREVFKKSQFIKSWTYYHGEDMFRGIYNGIELEFSELHVTQKSNKSSVTVFKGPFFKIMTEFSFQGRTTVVRDYAEKLLGNFGRGLQKLNFTRDKLLKIENEHFENEFAVYSDNENEAKAILNEGIINFLLNEQQKAKQVFFGFSENTIYFGIFNSHDLYKVNIREEINETVLETVFNELMTNLNTAEELYNLVIEAQKSAM